MGAQRAGDMLGAMEPRLRAMIFAIAPGARRGRRRRPAARASSICAISRPPSRRTCAMRGFDNFTGRPLPGYGAPECVLRRDVAQALAKVRGRSRQAAAWAQGLRLLSPDARGRGLCALGATARRRRDQALLPRAGEAPPVLARLYRVALGAFDRQRGRSHAGARCRRRRPPAFDARAVYGPCTAPAAKRAPDNHRPRHGHRLRLLRRQEPHGQRSNRARAEAPARYCSLPPCARAASTIISANGGTSASARAGRLMILRLGARDGR